MPLLSIGQVAKHAHVSHDTIRLYERYGLIHEPQRAANGYRQYPAQAVDCLKFIIRAKNMGFTLREIRELLAIHQTSRQTCGDVRQRTQDKLRGKAGYVCKWVTSVLKQACSPFHIWTTDFFYRKKLWFQYGRFKAHPCQASRSHLYLSSPIKPRINAR